MDKRYQLFVSSTFEDLKEERKAVIESILQMKHIPAGMELFAASNDEQFEYIKRIIDNCDYYVLIIAGRYGSINTKTGISYTEQEYEYAIEKNIPILVFLYSNIDNLPTEKKDAKQEELKQFVDKASRNRLCKPWSNIGELRSSTIISLHDEFSKSPQQGWVRGDGFNNSELLEQINQMRIEKDKLNTENINLKVKINEYNSDIKNLAKEYEKFKITGFRYGNDGNGKYPFESELPWYMIFSLITPFLMSPLNYFAFKLKLQQALSENIRFSIRELNEDCVQTIKIQLLTANLINVYSGNTTQGGLAEFIVLTEKGLQYLKELKSVKTQEKFLPISIESIKNLGGISLTPKNFKGSP